MKSVSFAKDDFDSIRCYQILTEIKKLYSYFYKFNKGNVDVAMSDALYHALEHYNPEKGDLVPYLKKLAREISKPDPRMTYVDFLEQTASEDVERYGRRTTVVSEGDLGSDYIEEKNTTQPDKSREQIVELALQHMNFFMVMCESLRSRNTATKYFPKAFKTSCLRLINKIPDFTKICMSIYDEYANAFREFIAEENIEDTKWRELDAGLVKKYTSKRVKFYLKGNPDVVCTDPDRQEWEIRGALSGKRIFKVPYKAVYDYMMDLIDSDVTNQIKFCIDDSYIFRTLGGSISCVNSSLFNQYNVFLLEVITNLLYDLGARYLMTGSECLYFLAPANKVITGEPQSIPHRVIRGIELKFSLYDVTPVSAEAATVQEVSTDVEIKSEGMASESISALQSEGCAGSQVSAVPEAI